MSNDQIILDQILEQQRCQRSPTSSKSSFFETYVVEQILKDADLSDEEIDSGIVGDGGDGGIDAIYIFANGELVREDFDASPLKKNANLDVVIVQSKTSAGFDEDTLNRLVAVTNDLFDLSKSLEQFKTVYNSGVRSAAENFRAVFQSLAARFPTLQFRYVYASRGDAKEVHPNVVRKTLILKEAVERLFSASNCTFQFLGASDLLALARQQPTTTFNMQVAESISAQGGYIALVRLGEFAKFIRDEKGHLRKNIFDANVRDYQGATQVNEDIQKSLSVKGQENFWWLNNGVTVIATNAVQSGKTITIEAPQIVNGLQTSTEIHKHFEGASLDGDDRAVLVRIIVSDKSESSDRIIKATNSQTSIPPASLRATDKIHRDIEEYLKPFGLFYDRRKNMHKNDGRPSDQIVSIPLMAQAIMSIFLHRPADARARPSSLLKRDDDYSRIFSPDYPIELYLVAGKLVKSVQSYLRDREDISGKDKNNLLFYVTMFVASILSSKARPSKNDLSKIKFDNLRTAVEESVTIVQKEYVAHGASDQVAKGTALLSQIERELEHRYSKNLIHPPDSKNVG